MKPEDALIENVAEFLREARKSKNENAFNSATTLFFKALAVAVYLFLFKREGFIPSKHTKRFKILKQKYPEIYRIMDKDFPLYQDSYRPKMTKEIVEVLEDDTKRIIQLANITLRS